MKTTLLFRLKNKVRKLFGLRQLYQHPKKDITVRMDLLNHTVSDEKRDEIREMIKGHRNFSAYDIEESILNARDNKSVREEFNALPFGRLSDGVMLEIIKLVRLDLANRAYKLENHTEGLQSVLDELSDEMEKNIK
jgi:hypothetical protein